MPAVFLTGFPGFLGSALAERLLDRYPTTTTLDCLIQAKFRPLAEQRVEAIEAVKPTRIGRIRLFDGDITVPGLGLGERYAELQQETHEIYHLAAVYDLGVKRDVGMRINVDGTHHMLEFAQGCPNLRRFQYVSTCYVSGRHPGLFTENDLAKGQEFNNYYEETKYLAEVEVQDKMRQGLPTTIYRPAIVVGDSQTGATQKYDGAYYFLQLLARQPQVAFIPTVGHLRYEFNIVPRDYVIDALAYLSSIDASLNQVYHLSDPNAPTVDTLLKLFAQATDRRVVRIPVTKWLAKTAVKQVPGVRQLLRVEPEGIDYYLHPTLYTCDNALRDLKGSGIACPPLALYVDKLVAYYKMHPEITAAAMV